jgi:hypothetical protein
MYTYTSNIPQANQLIKATQGPILSNFQAINELLSVNHVGFNDSINFGKHTFTSLVFQNSDPTTSANEMALYAKTSTDVNGAEIFYRYPSNGTVVQLTGTTSGNNTGLLNTNGYSYLTSSLFMKWGQVSGIVAGTNTITFPTGGGIPAFTTSVYFVQWSPNSSYTLSTSSGYVTNVTLTNFQIVASTTISSTIYWMALGV